MVALNFKTQKCRLKDILRLGEKYDKLYEKFFDCIYRTDKLTKLCTIFVRAYLLHLIKQNPEQKLPPITTDFIRMAFKALMINNNKGAKPKGNNKIIYESLKIYYKEFQGKLKIELIDGANLSFLYDQMNDQMIINIHNNIEFNFKKHLSKYIYVHFKKDIDDKISKIPSSNRTEIKKIKTQHYNELKKINDDILNNTDTCIIKEHIDWIKEHKPNVIPLDSTFEELIDNDITSLIKPMFFMGKYMETNNIKSYQAFPIKTKVYPNYVKINSSALISIFLDESKARNKPDIEKKSYCQKNTEKLKHLLWEKFFNLKKFKLKDHIFNCEIETDGFAVSLNFIHKDDVIKQKTSNNNKKNKTKETNKIRKEMTPKEMEEYNKKEKEKNTIKNKQNRIKIKQKNEALKKLLKEMTNEEREIYKLKEASKKEFQYIENMVKEDATQKMLEEKYKNGKIVYADPGKKSILCLMADDETKPKEGNKTNRLENHKFLNYTNKERIRALKRLKYGELIENKKKKITTMIDGKTIKEIENELINFNSKSCIYDEFIKYATKKSNIDNKLYDIFNKKSEESINMNDYYRKLKWFSYLNKRKHEDKLINKIQEKFGKDILLVIGDWGDQGRLNFISTPNKGIKRKLMERISLCLIDEYNTSKYHYKHEVECDNMSYKIKDIPENKLIRFKNKKTGKITTKKVSRKVKRKVKKNNEKVDEIKVKKESRNLHSVLTYKLENNVMGCINRDKNACMNFKKIVKSLIARKERPLRFKREPKIDSPLIQQETIIKDKLSESRTGTYRSQKEKPNRKPNEKVRANLNDNKIITPNKKVSNKKVIKKSTKINDKTKKENLTLN